MSFCKIILLRQRDIVEFVLEDFYCLRYHFSYSNKKGARPPFFVAIYFDRGLIAGWIKELFEHNSSVFNFINT